MKEITPKQLGSLAGMLKNHIGLKDSDTDDLEKIISIATKALGTENLAFKDLSVAEYNRIKPNLNCHSTYDMKFFGFDSHGIIETCYLKDKEIAVRKDLSTEFPESWKSKKTFDAWSSALHERMKKFSVVLIIVPDHLKPEKITYISAKDE